MPLTLAQSAKPADGGKDRRAWLWAVWLDGTKAELDAVREVVYTLHPTFAEPVQRRKDRSNAFRLQAHGWGDFLIRARVFCDDGTECDLTHWLKLEPGPAQSTLTGSTEIATESRQIFLSAGLSDAGLAAAIAGVLMEHGIDIVTSEDLPPDSSLQDNLTREARASAALVVLVTSRLTKWARAEIDVFRDVGKPVIGVAVDGPSGPFSLTSDLPPVDWIWVKWMPDEAMLGKMVAESVMARLAGLT